MKRYENWVMRDGTKINIADMTEEHLRNTLNMLVKARKKAQRAALEEEILRDYGSKDWMWK